MGNTETTLEFKESSAFGDSDKGFQSEALQIEAAGRSLAGSGCGEGSVLGNSADWCLSDAPQMGAAGRGLVEQEGSVWGTSARIFRRALIKGNSSAWGFHKEGTGQDSCLPGVGEAPIFWGQHLSPSYFGFPADLERACGGQGEEGSQSVVGL